MAVEAPGAPRATLAHDELPPDPRSALRNEMRPDYDCMSCRVMGASAFITLGGYTYFSGHKQLRDREREIMKSGTKLNMNARRFGIKSLSAVLVGLGIYRFFA